MKLHEIPTYQSKYLRAADLRGRSVRVTIRSVTVEEFFNRNKNSKEKVAVLWFYNKVKGLVINKTRLSQLVEIFGGDDTDYYLDQIILLHPTTQRGKDTIFISGVPEED